MKVDVERFGSNTSNILHDTEFIKSVDKMHVCFLKLFHQISILTTFFMNLKSWRKLLYRNVQRGLS